MGCTAALAKRRFEEWRTEQISDQERYLSEMGPDKDPEQNEELIALSKLTWEEWCLRVPGVLSSLYEFDSYIDETDRRMRESGDEPWLWFDGLDSLISIRAIVEAAPDVQEIALNVGDLIAADGSM